jgi:hypothetical protein
MVYARNHLDLRHLIKTHDPKASSTPLGVDLPPSSMLWGIQTFSSDHDILNVGVKSDLGIDALPEILKVSVRIYPSEAFKVKRP